MKIYIMRHGQTDWNKEKRVQGSRHDTTLNETGREQARASREKIDSLGITNIYSSTLGRARETAEIATVNTGVKIVLDKRLCEHDVGNLSGKLNTTPDMWADFHANPKKYGGESLTELFNRVKGFLDWLKQQNHETTLLVMHAGIMRMFLFCAQYDTFDMDKLSEMYKISIVENCTIVKLGGKYA